QDLSAASAFAFRFNGIRKEQIFAEVAPEQVLDEPHRVWLGADQCLGVGNELLVLLRNSLERSQISHVRDTSAGNIGKRLYGRGKCKIQNSKSPVLTPSKTPHSRESPAP